MKRINRKWINNFFICSLTVMGGCFAGCGDNVMREYNALIEKEGKKDLRIDSIFFGIYLGMGSKDFYTHCWELNKQGLFTDGMGNTKINYKLVNKELKNPPDMNFYPAFTEGKISSMEVLFQYHGWGPWTKELDADKLLPDVVDLFKKWYPEGNDFIKTRDKKGVLFVKVDGNRQIMIGQYDDTQVKAEFTDLKARKK